jgi:hypothetical protein
MPVPNVGQIVAAAWEDYVAQDPADAIFDRYWLLENLREGRSFRKGAGDPITGTIEYAVNTTVKSMSELEPLTVERVDVFDRWEAQWKFVGGVLVMSDFERGITSGGAGKFDLYAAKLDNLKRSFERQINSDLYSDGTGNGGKQATGLQAIVSASPTTGTLEGINRAVFSFWRNQQQSGAHSSTAFDNLLAAMRKVYNSCSNGPGQQTPEFAVTTQTVFEGFEGLLTPLERYTRSSANDTGVTGFKGTQLMFKDIPLAYDADCPANTLYILNRRNLFIRYLYWMKAFPPQQPVNQFADVVKILTVYQLCTDNPRRLGVVTNIN